MRMGAISVVIGPSIGMAGWYSIAGRIASQTRRLPGPFRPLPSAEKGEREARMAGEIAAYAVEAYNTAKQSENKMHDDSVARRFGFAGGLVPGVEVLAYMVHQPVARWGRAFLERGLIEARFIKPVYDGEIAEVVAVEAGDGLS